MRKPLIALATLLAFASAAKGQSLQGQQTQESCLPELSATEARYHLPPGLLLSMALVESGRRDPVTGLVAPWPWTIQARGQSHFYESPVDAIRETKSFLQAGTGFVDVGCLQVDLFHHPEAFQNLNEAFDPHANIDYAARYLSELAHNRGSWLEAVAAYNAGNPSDGIAYLGKVLYLWKGVHLTAQAARAAPDNPQHVGFTLQEAPQPLDLAAQFYADRDYPAALTLYTEQLRHHPDDVAALLGAADVLSAQGHPDAARNRLELVLAIAPNHREALDDLLLLIDSLPADRQLPALLAAYRAAPAVADLPARIAVLQADTGQETEATASMAEALRLRPNDPIRQLDYALLLDRIGSANAARDAYRAFLAAYRTGGAPALTFPIERVQQRLAYLETTLQQP